MRQLRLDDEGRKAWRVYLLANQRSSDRYWGFRHGSRCNCGRFARDICTICKGWAGWVL